ncbi:MAG: hypothetical protein QOF78_287, partial [Phycisphaerales bacterium]|nr:hypothetical protein [Phycisphaerales bacterium]
AKQLNWDAKYSFGVNDFTARLRHLGQQITLASVEWPGHQVTASGWYHTGDRSWSLRMNGRDTATTDATGQTPFDFNVDARGDAKQVRLNELLLRAQEVELKASGLYDGHIPRPFDFEFLVTHEGPPPAPAAASPPASARATSPADEPPIRGRLFAEGRINGTQSPVNLDITGFLRTRNLVVLGREYGDIKGTITGSVKEADAWSAQFNVRDLSLFGGQWHITSVFPYTGKDRLTSGGGEPLRAKIVASGLKLKDLGDLLRTPLDGGDATGDFLIDIPFPGARGDTAAMSGTFGAKNVVLGEGGNERFRADEITGQMSLKHGVFRADPIKLRRAERDVSGDATLSVQTTLTDLKRPTVTLAAKTWPVKTGDAMAAVTADANLSVDVAKKSASGPIKARATFATTQRGIGEANVDAQIDGRVAVFRKITLDAIGGHAEGSGTIDADDPNRSTLTMSWSDIEGERLADLLPHFRGLTGAYSGAISLAPASADRALEPLRLTAGVTPVEGKFRAMEVGAMKFSAYLNLGKNFMLERIVLDAAPDEIRQAQRREAELDARKVALRDRPLDWNDIRIADGRIRLWARRGRHESAAQVQTHLIADFQNLDIDQLVHAMKPKSDAMPGRISGSMTIHGNPYDRDLVLGQGRVDITESDLANVDALALLYNATQLGHSTTQPTGNGSLELSLQASKLSLQNIRYFNRGIQARSSSIDIAEIWNMPDSKIFGFIVGSARPLKDLKLPLLADVDQILNIVQSGLTTVRIEGTVAEPKVKLVPFGEVNEALKRFIVGEVKNETRGE